METQGFYKKDGDNLLHAPNYVSAPNYELDANLKDSYMYPVDDWYWFESEELAKSSLINGAPLPYNDNGWQSKTCNMRIVASIALVNSYPELLFDLTVVRKLQIEQSGVNMLIYVNFIEPKHQELIDASNGLIYVENKPIN